MFQTISTAIGNRNLLEFYYDGYFRLVEPFTLGVSQKNNTVLSGFQIDGRMIRGTVPDWQLFKLEKIVSLQVSEQKFTGNRDGYKRGDSRMKQIYCEVE